MTVRAQEHTAAANVLQIDRWSVPHSLEISATAASSSNAQPFNLFLEDIDSLLESLEIQGDKELMASIRQGMKEAAEGKGQDLEDVFAELGW
jgi:hypothetical protein